MAQVEMHLAAALDMAGFRVRPLLRRWQAIWSVEQHVYFLFYYCEPSNTWRRDNGSPQCPTLVYPRGIRFVAVEGEDGRWVDARPHPTGQEFCKLWSTIIVCDRCRPRRLLQLRPCRVCRPMPLSHSLPDLRLMALPRPPPPPFSDASGTTIAGTESDDDNDDDGDLEEF